MGSNHSKEAPETWNSSDVEKWKLRAVEGIKSYYLGFRGSQFDEYMLGEDENLLLAKICYALYGPPTVTVTLGIWDEFEGKEFELSDGYEPKQLENAKEILKLILEVHSKKKPTSKQVLVGIIFISCKQDEFEYVLPIFSVFTGHDALNAHAARSYVDTQKRVYDSWDDWKSNNTMPMLKYAFPRRGFFTSSLSHAYEFDEEKCPDIEFGSSPACSTTSRVLGTTDAITGITALGCGVIGLASMFTPIGPSVLAASMYGGLSSAVYGSTRAAVRLHDKGTHGESLTDLESLALVFSIVATPLHFTSSLVNAQLVRGAVVNGRIFSSSMRMFATVLNFSTLGVDGVMLAFGIANLIDKAKQDQLKPLDVLQFSMSVFFFTNTLIRPQMASSIIKNAQDMHIQNYANNLSDAEAQSAFNKFLDANKGDGKIKDTSTIVRTINRISDPNKIFGDLNGAADIKIGGRKGKTLLIKKGQNVERINPSKMTTDVKLQPGNVVGCPGVPKDSKEDAKKEPKEDVGSIADDTVSKISTGTSAQKIISGLAGISTLAAFLEELKEKIESIDAQELINLLYDKVLREYPELINEIESTVKSVLRLQSEVRNYFRGEDPRDQAEGPRSRYEQQYNEDDHLFKELNSETDFASLNSQELVNLDTKHVLGGLSEDVANSSNFSEEFEVNFAPPRDEMSQTAFLMLKNDFEGYQMTGRKEILAVTKDLTTAIKMEMTLLNTRRLLLKYSVCVLQWIEKIIENRLMSKEESIEVYEHFHKLIEASEGTLNYEFNGIEMTREQIELFFYRVKAIILLKKFVMNLSDNLMGSLPKN